MKRGCFPRITSRPLPLSSACQTPPPQISSGPRHARGRSLCEGCQTPAPLGLYRPAPPRSHSLIRANALPTSGLLTRLACGAIRVAACRSEMLLLIAACARRRQAKCAVPSSTHAWEPGPRVESTRFWLQLRRAARTTACLQSSTARATDAGDVTWLYGPSQAPFY